MKNEVIRGSHLHLTYKDRAVYDINIARYLFQPIIFILVMFATIDGLRDTFLPGSYISFLKEGFVVLLFIFYIYRGVWFFRKNTLIFLMIFIFILIYSAVTTYYNADIFNERGGELSYGGWSFWIKLIVALLLTNVLIWLKEEHHLLYRKIPYFYIAWVAFYCVLTIFFIISGLSSDLVPRNWDGRLSIGYPTMDSFVLIMGIVFVTFIPYNTKYKFFLALLFFSVLIMQNTATGYILLITYLFLVSLCFKGVYRLFSIFVLLAFIFFLLYTYINLIDSLGNFGYLIQDKLNSIILGTSTSSVSIREGQINDLFLLLQSDLLSLIFGLGGSAGFSVENQYFSILAFSGLIGLFVYTSLLSYLPVEHYVLLQEEFAEKARGYSGFSVVVDYHSAFKYAPNGGAKIRISSFDLARSVAGFAHKNLKSKI